MVAPVAPSNPNSKATVSARLVSGQDLTSAANNLKVEEGANRRNIDSNAKSPQWEEAEYRRIFNELE
jgi:hypothetical protein